MNQISRIHLKYRLDIQIIRNTQSRISSVFFLEFSFALITEEHWMPWIFVFVQHPFLTSCICVCQLPMVCNKLLQTYQFRTKRVYYLTDSVGQESRHILLGFYAWGLIRLKSRYWLDQVLICRFDTNKLPQFVGRINFLAALKVKLS